MIPKICNQTVTIDIFRHFFEPDCHFPKTVNFGSLIDISHQNIIIITIFSEFLLKSKSVMHVK